MKGVQRVAKDCTEAGSEDGSADGSRGRKEGHSPEVVAEAIAKDLQKGATVPTNIQISKVMHIKEPQANTSKTKVEQEKSVTTQRIDRLPLGKV